MKKAEFYQQKYEEQKNEIDSLSVEIAQLNKDFAEKCNENERLVRKVEE